MIIKNIGPTIYNLYDNFLKTRAVKMTEDFEFAKAKKGNAKSATTEMKTFIDGTQKAKMISRQKN